MQAFSSVMETPAFLPIDFVVVGASVCGLSCAIALSRAGHTVTVFDPIDPFSPHPIDAACRLPPNATKLFYRWGMEHTLKASSVKSTGTIFAQYQSGAIVGSHEWEEEVLGETGGDFLLLHHSHLRRILAERARELKVIFRCPGTVVGVKAHPERPAVTLECGEVVEADVVLFADGHTLPTHLGRKVLLEAWDEEDEGHAIGMQLFNVLLPEQCFEQVEDKQLLSRLMELGKVFMWFGPDIGALGYQVKAPSGEKLFSLLIHTPRHKEGDLAYVSDADELLQSLKDADPSLVALASKATQVSVIPMINRAPLEEWVHPDGRVMCLGECAHPHVLGSIYSLGMAAGDAAFLGRLFSHLHTHSQIDAFLRATQEMRQPRVEHVLRTTAGNVFAVSMPPAIAAAHDRSLRRRTERAAKTASVLAHHGHASLAPAERAEQARLMMQAVEDIFGHDPEDAADDWWVEWGLLQESATRWNLHVQEEEDEEEGQQREDGT